MQNALDPPQPDGDAQNRQPLLRRQPTKDIHIILSCSSLFILI
jgi:hypothetical protein